MTLHAFGQIEWLAQTKFIPPVLRPDILARPRLAQTLEKALSANKVVLVSAPAGYGKTTLIATLPHVLPQLAMAWVSLDEGDNDPVRFIVGLMAALKQLNSALGQHLQSFLTATDALNKKGEMPKLMGLLINEIVESLPQPFVLVLDDLHRISEAETLAALNYLIERLPEQMHLVIGTRYDPPLALARLRARGQLEELRVQDLRFTPSETATLLNVSLKLDLSSQALTSLRARLEGWAAGLRLFASSFTRLPHQLDRDSFIRNLAGSERYVYDFLAEEVLNQQEAPTRRFLLETSILTELTPSLCEAVTEQQDSMALLEELYRRNLTIAVEHTLHVYRYHDLFKTFLQHHLSQETRQRFVELHQRAAEAETDPSRTIHHYLEAQLWEKAAQEIEQAGKRLLQEGLLITVRDWIAALPDATCEQHPRLFYYLGICAWQRGDTATVKKVLKRAITGFAANGEVEEQGESLVILANTFISEYDTLQGGKYLEEALRFPIAPSSRVLLLMTRVWQNYWQQEWDQAARDVDEAINIGLSNLDTTTWNVLGLQFRMELAILPDGIARIERFWQSSKANQIAEKNTILKASLFSLQVFSHLMRGELAKAVQVNESVLQHIDDLKDAIWLFSEVLITALHLYLACDDSLRLDDYLELVRPFKSYPFFGAYQFIVSYSEGRAHWQRGRIEEARQIYKAFPVNEELPDSQYLRFLLQALLEIADQQYHRAESTLKAAQGLEQSIVLARSIADVTSILAYLYLQWNKQQKALTEFEPLLVRCKAENTPGLILREGVIIYPLLELALKKGYQPDIAAKLLHLAGQAAISSKEAARTSGLLSLREAEVLELLADGLSNREIAERLIISELTVKSHVTHLIQKLDATSRTGAVSRARQLGLLS